VLVIGFVERKGERIEFEKDFSIWGSLVANRAHNLNKSAKQICLV
jgi:hypothetical protein